MQIQNRGARSTQSQKPSKKPTLLYGSCQKCGSAITFPGLEAKNNLPQHITSGFFQAPHGFWDLLHQNCGWLNWKAEQLGQTLLAVIEQEVYQ